MSNGVPYAKLTKQLTVLEISEMTEELISLSDALKLIPKEFDASFQQKLNRILDITNEIEHHSNLLKKNVELAQNATKEQIKNDNKELISTISKEIKGHLNDYMIINKYAFFAIAIASSSLVGIISGFVFYFLAVSN